MSSPPISNLPLISSAAPPPPPPPPPATPDVVHLITALQNPDTREEALRLLSKNRSIREDMAPLLWHSFGTMTILLQEITSVYPLLSNPELTEKVSHRVCNALVLLQGVATHPETKTLFIKAKIPLYLHAFLNNPNLGKPHEYLRLTSLGIFGALVKTDNEQAIEFILKSSSFPCFLHCMEVGTELTKTVAAYILHRVLSNDKGMNYCCTLAERFYTIGRSLRIMLEKLIESGRLTEESSKRLLKHIIWCYYRLSDRPRPCDGFKLCLPMKMRDSCVINAIRDDQQATEPYLELLQNVAKGFISTKERTGFNSRSGSYCCA